jgi:hypothetical protein
VTDPRSRTDGLGWVTRALFADRRLALTVGDRGAVAPSDAPVALARFVIVPSVPGARFLLPLAAWPVRSAALLAYNRLRPPGVRRRRALLAAAVRTHPTLFGRLPVLTVWAPRGVAAEDVLVAGRVQSLLDVSVHAAIGVHTPDPNAKPTLQLIAASGSPAAYVKIGWNDATRALVATEAAALGSMPRAPHHPLAPALLHAGTVGDGASRQDFVAAAPLPADVRGVAPDAAPEIEAVLAVARVGGPPTAPVALVEGPVAARLGGRFTPVLDRHGTVALEFGRWHGDWVPWNLARSSAGLVAWDWEHSAAGMPVGSDVVHHAFQVALTLRHEDAAAATRAAEAMLAAHAERLGLSAAAVPAVVDVYLAELWLRTERLAAGGAGWNPKLHPALLDVLRARLG